MKKKKNMIASLLQSREAKKARMNEIADLVEREARSFTDQENTELDTLRREITIADVRIKALSEDNYQPRDVTAMARETLLVNNQKCVIELRREALMTNDVDGTGIIPIEEQEMIKPIRTGLIYDKVGLKIMFGLPGGELRWPKHTKATAYWGDEGERAPDSSIDFTKLSVKPHRIMSAVPVTKELLESSAGVVEQVVEEEMPLAVIDLVNEAMFTTSGSFTDKEGKDKTRKVFGPFVAAAKKPFQFAGPIPTRKELLKMKAKLIAAVGKLEAACWVMTETMKAELEDVKVDAGSGRFLCENDVILGLPVYTTPEIGEGNVGLGEWSYQAAGFFGPISMAADPYTLLRNNSVDFVLNTHFATVTLLDEAFILGIAGEEAEEEEEEEPGDTIVEGEGGQQGENE